MSGLFVTYFMSEYCKLQTNPITELCSRTELINIKLLTAIVIRDVHIIIVQCNSYDVNTY